MDAESLFSAVRRRLAAHFVTRRKRRLRKTGITVAFTDPKNPMRDWKP